MPDSVERAIRFGAQVFRETFDDEPGRFALAELRQFCGAAGRDVYMAPDGRLFLSLDHPHFDPTSDAQERGENLGRLRVYQRIQRYVCISDQTIDEAARVAAERVNGGEGNDYTG